MNIVIKDKHIMCLSSAIKVSKDVRWGTLFASVLLGFACISRGHVSPVPTRVIYHAGAKFTPVAVHNSDPSQYYGLETWTESCNPKNPGQRLKSTDDHTFFVSPKFVTVPPKNKKVMLHIIQIPGSKLPTDREKLFYLEFQEAPPLLELNPKLNKPDKKEVIGGLQITIHTQIKLIYRPKDIAPVSNKVLLGKISAIFYGNMLIVYNQSPYVINSVDLFMRKPKELYKAKGNREQSPTIFKPYSHTVMLLKRSGNASHLIGTDYLIYINDYGGDNVLPITVKRRPYTTPVIKHQRTLALVNGEVV